MCSTEQLTGATIKRRSGADAQLPGRLAGLSVWRQVLVLAIWPFLEQLLGFCVGFVDTAIAGRLSVAATEAIAVAAYIGWLLVLLFGAVGVGAGALVARAIGGRHRQLAHAVLGQALMAVAMLGTVLAVLVFLLAEPCGRLLNLNAVALGLGTIYLQILAVAVPAHGLLYVGAACLRASGDTRTPFRILGLVNVVNVMLSLLLVFGPAPMGGHGVAGIAVGTATAWVLGAGATVLALLSGDSPIRLRWFRLRPHRATLRRILRISSPQFIDSLATWTGNFIVASFVGYLGHTMQPGALGAHVIVIRIEAISYLPAWALAVAASTLTGQYLGLGDPLRARKATHYCWLLSAGVTGTLGLVFLLFPGPLVRLVTSEPRLLEMAIPLLRICGPAQIFLGTSMVLDQAIRGAGDTRPAMLIVTASTFLLRVPAAYLIGVHFAGGVAGIWIAVCSEIAIRACVLAAYYASGRWSRVVV